MTTLALSAPVNWSALGDAERSVVLRRPALRPPGEVATQVAEIVAEVRQSGDDALRRYSERFDGVVLTELEVRASEVRAALASVRPEARAALEVAARNLATFHEAERPAPIAVETIPGVRCRREPRPIDRVGLYAPGGNTPLPSTVLMLGVPARIAGCPVRVLCTPPRRDGTVDPHILAAAALCGIERVVRIGGAQAIAALAYGTATVPKCDKIFGPGSAWVTEAKLQVARDPEGAAIDLPAGPSELLVIADGAADPRFVAADLLSQAEHGPDSQVVLVSTDAALLEEVRWEVARRLERLPRREIAARALASSRWIMARDVDEALACANRYAPEHLILQVADPEGAARGVRNAGSVFLGPWAPESVGDYASGTNHVLPTYGFARALSGLSVDAFMKQITFQELTRAGLARIAPTVEELAAVEGLEAHRQAVAVRLEPPRERS